MAKHSFLVILLKSCSRRSTSRNPEAWPRHIGEPSARFSNRSYSRSTGVLAAQICGFDYTPPPQEECQDFPVREEELSAAGRRLRVCECVVGAGAAQNSGRARPRRAGSSTCRAPTNTREIRGHIRCAIQKQKAKRRRDAGATRDKQGPAPQMANRGIGVPGHGKTRARSRRRTKQRANRRRAAGATRDRQAPAPQMGQSGDWRSRARQERGHVRFAGGGSV